jgi:peptidoglycan-associated lipoprotein
MLAMMRPWLCGLLFGLLAACVQPAPQPTDTDRLLVYFDEFSAHLTPEALQTVADAANRARQTNARSIRIEARASATGAPTANHYLAMTRSQVVADALAQDGLDRATFHQVWIGQTGSGDTSVAERRVDIVLEH